MNDTTALTGTEHEIRMEAVRGFTQEMSAWAGDFADDYDWVAIREDYNKALSKRAPEGVSWGWTEQGPYCYADIALDPDSVREAWAAAIAPGGEGGIDFDRIAMRHALPHPDYRLVWVQAGPGYIEVDGQMVQTDLDALKLERWEDGEWVFETQTQIDANTDSSTLHEVTAQAMMRDHPGTYAETVTYW